MPSKALIKENPTPTELDKWEAKFFRRVNSQELRAVNKHGSDEELYRYRDYLTFEWKAGQVTFTDALLDSLAAHTTGWPEWTGVAIDYVDQVWAASGPKRVTPAKPSGPTNVTPTWVELGPKQATPVKAKPVVRTGESANLTVQEGGVQHGVVKTWHE